MIEIQRGAIHPASAYNALHLIHTDWLTNGISGETMHEWVQRTDWFPHLKWEPEIVALTRDLPNEWQEGPLCDPQILLQFPHNGDWVPEIEFHTDKEPDWANGRRYQRIVGIALSGWNSRNGGLRFPLTQPVLQERDAIMFTPDEPHSGGVNLTGHIRYGVYFRWLA